jgi:hypothetical protein
MSAEEYQREAGEAARRAGAVVTELLNSMVEDAERQADRIRTHAAEDADRTRQEAIDSARRLLEHLHALERPLGQLVMNLQAEVDRVAGELGSGHVDAGSVELPAGPDDGEEVRAADVEADSEEAVAEAETPPPPSEPEEAPEEAEAAAESEPSPRDEGQPDMGVWEPTASESAPATTPPRQGLFSRLRGSRTRPFVGREGHCAVCQRAFMAGSVDSLEVSGWLVSGEVGVCPDCQADGWQLPEGASLPFRRGGG